MKTGMTMLIIGLFALIVGFLFRTNRVTFWGRMFRALRFNRFFFILMGRRPIRRLLRI